MGYLKVTSFAGAPVRLHWTLPLGLLVFGGFHFAPVVWLCYAALVLAHEMGHATLVKLRGGEVVSIDLHALGGECRWTGSRGERDEAIVAWGGVLAQLAVMVLAYVLLHGRQSDALAEAYGVFTTTNLELIVLNLLPIPPLDGSRAWKLFAR